MDQSAGSDTIDIQMDKLYYNSHDTRIEGIVSRCPTLHEVYKPPLFCKWSWLNVAVTIIKEKLLANSIPLKRETIICPDGGEISIDWADDTMSRNLPEDAPILAILHTITGSSRQNCGFMRYASLRGWRSCVLNRRGHSGMPIRVIPHFSIMGNVDDTVLMVESIRKKFPDNFLGLAGLSAGSGQVVSYIGREGDSVKANAAASLCPAWDISKAFGLLKTKYPRLDSYITRSCIDLFIRKPVNQTALSRMPSAASKAERANNLEEFMEAAAPLAGCDDLESFYKENNPMQYYAGNKIPCLVLNALDDFLCLKENIRTDLKDQIWNYVLYVTQYGGHVGYNEGWLGSGNFMWRLTLDFFETVRIFDEK